MSAVTLDGLIFGGSDSEDVTRFFSSFKRRAIDVGRQRDDEWLLHNLEACLVGSAMIYYVTLDDSLRRDFDSARAALITRFSPHAIVATQGRVIGPTIYGGLHLLNIGNAIY